MELIIAIAMLCNNAGYMETAHIVEQTKLSCTIWYLDCTQKYGEGQYGLAKCIKERIVK